MLSPEHQIVMLPDPMMDHRWLATVVAKTPSVICPHWPVWGVGDNISTYVSKSVSEWTEGLRPHLVKEAPVILAGVGFGAPFAMEASKLLQQLGYQLHSVLVIGGCKTSPFLPTSLRMQWPVIRWLPDSMVRTWLRKRWYGIPYEIGEWTPELREMVKTLMAQISMQRVRLVIPALLDWAFTEEDAGSLGVRVHQIHGRKDRIIPLPRVQDATLLMHGDHSIHLSKEGEVTRWMTAIKQDADLRLKSR